MTEDSTDVDFFHCTGCERECRILSKKGTGEPHCCPFGILIQSGTISKVTVPSEYVSENVDHPSHYGGKDNPYETIKVADALGWGLIGSKFNALKYLMRAGNKDGESELKDLEKCKWFIQHAIELLEGKEHHDRPIHVPGANPPITSSRKQEEER